MRLNLANTVPLGPHRNQRKQELEKLSQEEAVGRRAERSLGETLEGDGVGQKALGPDP